MELPCQMPQVSLKDFGTVVPAGPADHVSAGHLEALARDYSPQCAAAAAMLAFYEPQDARVLLAKAGVETQVLGEKLPEHAADEAAARRVLEIATGTPYSEQSFDGIDEALPAAEAYDARRRLALLGDSKLDQVRAGAAVFTCLFALPAVVTRYRDPRAPLALAPDAHAHLMSC